MSSGISNKRKTLLPYQHLVENLKLLLRKHDLWNECYVKDIPKHWERHGELILLPSSCFSSAIWKECPYLWETVAEVLKSKKVARKYAIKDDHFRSPHVELLLGDNGWTTCVENGIKYTYDATKCMFSAGNITEKIRISKLNCSGETVVDMYAGIGYFTLPYLVHAKATVVHACEWNPNAVEALQKNLIVNKVNDRCIIHYGDCRKVCPIGIADRVNLGLLPTSESGWRTACLALSHSKGGILHIHCNVASSVGRTQITLQKNDTLCSVMLKKCSDQTGSSFDEHAAKNLKSMTQNSKHEISLRRQEQWIVWGNKTAKNIKELMFEIYAASWNVTLLHIHHVKSYAPHIDHVVADIECRP